MVSVHAPFTSLNIAALNPGVRAESIRQVLAAIDLCADIGGKLAQLGSRLVQSTAKKLSAQFFQAFKERVEG